MAKIKGQNLRIILNGEVITAAASCQVRIQASVQDTSSKDTVGAFAQNEVTGLAWEVTSDAAVWTGDGPGANTADLLEYRGATVAVDLAVTTGDYNAEVDDVLLYGNAIVKSITVTARNRQNGTCTVILTGHGPLTIPQWLCDVEGLVLTGSDGTWLTVAQ